MEVVTYPAMELVEAALAAEQAQEQMGSLLEASDWDDALGESLHLLRQAWRLYDRCQAYYNWCDRFVLLDCDPDHLFGFVAVRHAEASALRLIGQLLKEESGE